MIDKWQKIVLNRLIDKYERTSAFRQGKIPDKRVFLNFYGRPKTDISEYNIENNSIRVTINDSVMKLSQEKLIFYEWMFGESNHIISRVWLNFNAVEDVYNILGRMSTKDIMTSLCDEITTEISKIKTVWINDYYRDTLAFLKSHFSTGNRLPKNKTERKNLYTVMRFIDSNPDTVLTERVFSEKCFGDSKYFEMNVKSTLLYILRKYLDSNSSDTDLLQMIGIIKYPEQLELCGNFSLTKGSNMCNFEMFNTGICLYADDIDKFKLSIDKAVKKIISIENRANYFAYISQRKNPDEIVIYHGGHYSPYKKKLFKAVSNSMGENCKWCHWGDIDFGGFSMLKRLREEINKDILPCKMNVDELVRYDAFTMPFSDEYAIKLKMLRNSDLLSDCRDCIDYMLKNKVRLEQEAMLT